MNLFVYIGFPKTGNTSLHYFFLKSKRVNYLIESSTERKLTNEFDFIWKSIIFDNLKTFKLKIKNNRNKIISSISTYLYRSGGVHERRIFSLGALPGWVVRDSVFLVVLVLVVLVRPGGAAARDPSVPSPG